MNTDKRRLRRGEESPVLVPWDHALLKGECGVRLNLVKRLGMGLDRGRPGKD